ncbi:MAG: hypothetical protein ACXVIH_09840 [Ilumatobacteraceae bacterium]
MERRLAITYAVSTTAVLCTACVAVASVSGGLFAHAAPSINAGVKRVELVDNYIVVRPKAPTAPKSALMQAFVVAPPSPAPTDPPTTLAAAPAAEVQPPAPAPAPAPAPRPAPQPAAAPAPAPAPDPTTAPRRVSSTVPAEDPTPTRDQPPTTDGTYQPHVRHHHSDDQPPTTSGDD